MHLIKDENGNPIPHGGPHDHHHDHHHECGHSHESHCGTCDGDCRKETLALLAYMKQHNEQHAAELLQMAENLDKLEMHDAAAQIREGVTDFQKGNMRLSLALTLVQEAMKEV